MSKRFGRNQKRRMRQETQALEELRKHDKQAIDNLRSRIDDHRGFLEYILDLVGQDSILNPEPRMVDAMEIDRGSKVIYRSYPQFHVNDSNLDTVRDYVSHALRTRVILDRVRGAVHFLASMRNGDVVYALTDEAIATMSAQRLTAVLHKHIARQLAHQLALVLKR